MVEFEINSNGDFSINDKNFIKSEIANFKASRKRFDMRTGERYYVGNHDILKRKRTAIGGDGESAEVTNLPNNKIVNNQFKKMVDQKANYLLGRPFSMQGKNEEYLEVLGNLFTRKFNKLLKNIGEDSLIKGIGWLYIHYNELGELDFKRFLPDEVIPLWADKEHTVIDCVIRIYEMISYEDKEEEIIEKVEIYHSNGISFFQLNNNDLEICEPYHQNFFYVGATGYNWTKLPLIPFKYNVREKPLINQVKSLQDGLNLTLSNFQNNMEEDARNTIIVIKNYDGENLGEFRKNLATYGAVKIDSEGGVNTLQVEVNSENYKTILEEFKKAIIENAMGYDAKDDRVGGNANQMNIQSMYSDIDLDANSMENEFQASFDELLYFIKLHLCNTNQGDFTEEKVDIIFNRDMLMNEGEIITNLTNSIGILSNETIVANHPWVSDVASELDRLADQKATEISEYDNLFATNKVIEDE